MKKFCLKLILVILPLLIAFAFFPIERRNRYIGLKDDCFNHGIWIFDRLYQNEKAVDVAFIGSSHTVNGINDKLIEDSLKQFGAHVLNLGYCRLGRNLSYVFVKELIRTKKPKTIILEVMEDEDRYSHPIFPYIAGTADVFFPVLLFNRDMVVDMREAVIYKQTLIQEAVFSTNVSLPYSIEEFGFACSPDTASRGYLDEINQKKYIDKPPLSHFERDFYMKYPRCYLHKIVDICNRNSVNIYFLYLPGYGKHLPRPAEFVTYCNYGKVLIPPEKLFNTPAFWKDEEHLNQAGAATLSSWISVELLNEMKN